MAQHPRKFPRSQQTKLWQTTALAQVQQLRRSRVLHSSAEVTTDSHDAVNYHKMELEEQTRRDVAHESDATRTMTNRKSQSGEKKQTSARDTREPKPRIGTQEEVCNACLKRETATRSKPATGERETEHESSRS